MTRVFFPNSARQRDRATHHDLVLAHLRDGNCIENSIEVLMLTVHVSATEPPTTISSSPTCTPREVHSLHDQDAYLDRARQRDRAAHHDLVLAHLRASAYVEFHKPLKTP